jgi:eukaryotic-like serine/threonine-protein kinase
VGRRKSHGRAAAPPDPGVFWFKKMSIPRSIGRYRIQGLLGAGAMGEVYRAHDPSIDRPVAIKVLRPELITGSGAEQLLQRFRREARAAGRRFHPNIVAIWDFGEEDGIPFLVMELIEGNSLDEILKASGRLAADRSIRIMTQVLNALGFAHESGVIHRDVKPSNIMVLQQDHIKVADFGIARIDASDFTIVGDLLGTPAYMAPEQLSGGPVDHRTDLFAAGVILFEMLTGVKPFRGKSITEIMSFMERRGPEDIRALNPALPESLKPVLGKALAFDPGARYGAAAEFSAALQEAVSVVVTETPRPAPESSPPLPDEAALEPELLREIERDLASFLGPLASIAVKRALRQTSDVLDLYELLGKQLDNPRDRNQFLARGRQRAVIRLDRLRVANSTAPVSPRRERPVASAKPPNPASIVAIEADLTRYIGPIARILVKKELEKFDSLARFCLLLAAHIPDEKERKAFLAAHGAE